MPGFAPDAERYRAAKIALRDRLLADRRSMTASDRQSASASLQAALLALVRAQQPSTIAAYVPVLRQPTGERLGVDAIREASLVIVPAVAVDRSGVRLGRGGGSYDRVLARLDRVTLTVALLYDGELVESVPAEPHDRTVQAAITPSLGLSPSRTSEWTN